MEVFNSKIIGDIKIVDAFYGMDYKGIIPEATGLSNKDAVQQLVALTVDHDFAIMDFVCEIQIHWKIVLANFKFWTFYDSESFGIYENKRFDVLRKIRDIIKKSHQDLILPGGGVFELDYRIA